MVPCMLIAFCLAVIKTGTSEPACSKFHFEEQLLEKMIRMEIKMETLVNDINTRQNEMKNELTTSSEIFTNQLESITQERDMLKAQFSSLKDKLLEETTSQSGIMDNVFKTQQSLILRMSDDLRHLENVTVAKLTDLTITPTVAFKARQLVDTSLEKDQIFIFKTNMFNNGDGYNNATGVFTAPYDGLYFLTVQFCTSGTRAYFDILVENNRLTSGVMADKDYTTCHTTDAVAIMKSGMRAWVKQTRSSSTLYESEPEYRNTFSGLLIHK